jgi:glycosyltransferase involved in cell wall biosynthesis
LRRCLIVSQSDPVTGRLRTGPLLRLLHPPPSYEYAVARERLRYPAALGYYGLSPVSAVMAASRYFIEHSFPIGEEGHSLVHSFFWDARRHAVPWVHESDQSLGQFLSGYVNVKGPFKRRLTRGYAAFLRYSRCRRVVTWTEWAKKGFAEDGVDPSTVVVVPPPFPPISDRREHSGKVLLFLGRDPRRKGGTVALKAFLSARLGSGAKMIYVGQVSDPEARRLIQSDGRVTYYPRLGYREMSEDVWPVTDALLLPTTADAFAIAVVEAMSRGIPPVTSSIAPVAEVVKDGTSGLLATPGDVEGFSANIEKVMNDEPHRRRVGEEARARVEELFSPEEVGARIGSVYDHAL